MTNAVWNANLSVILQFLLYCERRGIVEGVIGLRNSVQSYNILLLEANPYPVHRLASKIVEPDEVVIPDDASFEAVLAAREKLVDNPVLRRRDTLLTVVLDEGLRRSEAARLPIDVVPSAQEVSALRSAAKASGIMRPVPIRVQGAKTGVGRVVDFSLSLVERLRVYIDEDRPFLGPEKAERSIFVSSRTGRALNPQSITNQYFRARSNAIYTARADGVSEWEIRDMMRVHPHVHRHRCITDSMTSKLEHGLDPLHAMLDVMNSSGITLETMLGYLHLGQSRRKSVLMKQGLVDQLKDDIVLERLKALDESKLRMISRKRRSRK
ncbi:tyrosine-type recombinase/integrase [Pseudorhizobium flavum]|uniref:Site-specific recombinase XerD n=1 Tax=Pseudorhizobium flavum TaxID=1335061 RepID=A0A7X0DE67_9HYPH|nr:tyrosine-type recombinase/integrase [Pseudorhizobium flavum]MBB6180786.1 site-specific recombinase XerD [Pseudorhizobium flavum]